MTKVKNSDGGGGILIHIFIIEEGKLYELYLDFDVERSTVLTGNGQYRMSPVVRCQPKVVSGEIAGTVQPTEANAKIWTVARSATVSTVARSNGFCKLMALPEGTYTVHIEATNTTYVGDDLRGGVVTRRQTANIGTITLQRRS